MVWNTVQIMYRRDAHFSIINDFYEPSHILYNHCPGLEYGRILVFGISAFCGHTFYTILFTFHECSFGISMRPCGWQVGFPHCPAITEITLSLVIRFLSLSEIVFFCAWWYESLIQLFNVFCSSKICLYFLRSKLSYFLWFRVFFFCYY